MTSFVPVLIKIRLIKEQEWRILQSCTPLNHNSMRHPIILIAVLICFSQKSFSQKSYKTLDSLESLFTSVWIDVKMPCQWEMIAKRKANGKLIFLNNDSTIFQFNFFKAASLPFYNELDTDFETTQKFYNWIKKKNRNYNKSISSTKIEENKENGYQILKIKDESGQFYNIFARHNDVACSIIIFNKDINEKDLLETLRQLHQLNKN